jgi:PAS domain-containing protein
MRRGATDYVFKDRMQRLVPVVNRAIEETEQRVARRQAESELNSTRERLDGIVSSLVDVVWSEAVSPRKVLYVSPATDAIYQRPPSDFYTSPDLWMQVIYPEDRAQVRQLWEKTVAGAPFDAEYRILGPDGEMRWVHDRGTPVRGADGSVSRIDRLTRDVTQRHTQQDKIERLTRIRDVLTSINAAIVRIRDRQQLFESTCCIAVEHGKFKMAWIGVAEPSGKKVTPVVWHGHNDGYLEEVGQLLRALPEDPGIAARVLREGSPIVVNDVNTNPRVVFKDPALKRGYRSCVVMPLVVDDCPVAVLTLFSAETGVFDQEEMRLLDDLAGDIGLAMAYIEKEKKLNFLAYYDGLTDFAAAPCWCND